LTNVAIGEVLPNDYWDSRECLRPPIPEIFQAAHLLDRAATAILSGQQTRAIEYVSKANMPEVRDWTESLWGSAKKYPKKTHYLRVRSLANLPIKLDKQGRMPNAKEKQLARDRYGYHCAYCGIPLIRSQVKDFFAKALPNQSIWGNGNASQHAAFQCLWLQYDHLIPHSYGGDNSIENIVITCAPCNYGKDNWLIEELGLMDPRKRPVLKTSWDGLERVLGRSGALSQQ
jgi:5-methylcytosine-specific restriction endonuclease McrA